MSLTATVLTDARIYLGGADLTGRSNKIEMAATQQENKITNFASGGWEERTGGIFDGEFSVDGFWEAGDAGMPDDSLWAGLAVATTPLTAVPTSGAVGSLAYMTRVVQLGYSPGGQVGSVLAWSATGKTDLPLARGQILHPQGTARSSTGSGTGIQLGAVSAAQRMYACLHVLSVSGTSTPTITVKIQSSADNTFASPTDQIVFAGATALGGQASSVLGSVTDAWWRAVWTISGSGPSFLFAVSAGVAAR